LSDEKADEKDSDEEDDGDSLRKTRDFVPDDLHG
jgi:hypothetical protein